MDIRLIDMMVFLFFVVDFLLVFLILLNGVFLYLEDPFFAFSFFFFDFNSLSVSAPVSIVDVGAFFGGFVVGVEVGVFFFF